MDQKIVRKLEQDIEEAVAAVISRLTEQTSDDINIGVLKAVFAP